jgi:hypothetical protein
MKNGGPKGTPLSLPLLGSNQDSSDPESLSPSRRIVQPAEFCVVIVATCGPEPTQRIQMPTETGGKIREMLTA